MPESTRDISGFGAPDAATLPFGKNYLLVIGIDRYRHCRPLANAVRDARALVEVLTSRFQFEPQNVIALYDEEATEANILNAFRDLVRTLTPADNLLIFFSGHGEYDDVLKEGYWIPVDARPGAFNEYFPNARLTTILNAMQARHIVLIADSCFSGALFMQYRHSGSPALERLERDPSRWGLTSGRQEPVADGEPGQHSPFAESLIYHLKHTRKPLPIAELCQRVTEDVLAASQQAPRGEPLRVAGHRGGQFVFHLREESRPQPLRASADQPLRTGRGHLMYNIPAQMETGRDTRCEVRIAFDRAALLEGIAEADAVNLREVRISNVMAVELIDPSPDEDHPFRIRSISSTEQFIDEEGYTQWIFYVKALREGVFPLVLKVSVVEVIAGKERRREIVLEETVEVRTRIEEPAPASYKRAEGMVFAVATPVAPPSAQPAMEEAAPAAPAPGSVASPAGTFTGSAPTAGGRPTASVPPPSPAAPSPKRSSAPSSTRKKNRKGALTRMAAFMAVVLIAGLSIWQFTRHQPVPMPVDKEKQYANKVATRIGELLAEAHRELGRTDPDFAKAKRAVEEAARLAKQENLPARDLEALMQKIERAERERANRPTGIVPEKPVNDLQQDVQKYIRTYNPEGQNIFRNLIFTFKDPRDGTVYPVRTYGEATWLGSNLKVRTPLSFCYDHKDDHCEKYGRLYQWAGARRACPQGWHLPSAAEWKSLLANLRSEEDPARALQPGGNTGFGLLAGGRKEPRTGKFSGLGSEAWFWTADQASASEAWAVFFNLKSGKWNMRKARKDMAASCRCVKD